MIDEILEDLTETDEDEGFVRVWMQASEFRRQEGRPVYVQVEFYYNAETDEARLSADIWSLRGFVGSHYVKPLMERRYEADAVKPDEETCWREAYTLFIAQTQAALSATVSAG